MLPAEKPYSATMAQMLYSGPRKERRTLWPARESSRQNQNDGCMRRCWALRPKTVKDVGMKPQKTTLRKQNSQERSCRHRLAHHRKR